jgi:hypothetical protein
MNRSRRLRITFIYKPDGTVVIVIEPPPAAQAGADRNSLSANMTNGLANR